jgi:hypothetical protein
MKRIATILFALAIASAFATAAGAQTHSPRIDRRETRQEARIHQGVRHGQLTRWEAARLQHGQRHVRRMEWRAKSDGRMSARERGGIDRSLDRQNRRIHRFRNNGRNA